MLSEPTAHVDAAPGNSGDTCAAIAVVTVMPLIVVGALIVHDQLAGQFVVPVAAQLPLSCVDTLTLEPLFVQVMLIWGLAGVLDQVVRVIV